jgi:hypothetical protein
MLDVESDLQVHFQECGHAGQVSAEHVFDRAEQLQATLLRGGRHRRDAGSQLGAGLDGNPGVTCWRLTVGS